MSTNRKIILICIVALVLTTILSLIINAVLNTNSENSGSLFNHGDTQTFDVITQEQYDEEYQNRKELPNETVESLESLIVGQLSAGNFAELDMQLKDWSENYKDNADQSNDESIVIDNYRADISYYKSMQDKDALSFWYFYNPETLAAAVAYSPISIKYKAFINRDSAVLPPANENILLHKVEMSLDEYRELLDTINRQRTEAAQYQSVVAYDMNILGYSCRLIEVRDTISYCYQPYALIVNDPTYFIKASFIDNIFLQDEDTDIDAMFAAPIQVNQ
jgi:hypothetical protein